MGGVGVPSMAHNIFSKSLEATKNTKKNFIDNRGMK
jgi:hypothetical protein